MLWEAELCTWREGLEWHTASLSSEPAAARVTPLFSKGGAFRCSCLSAMAFVPEDELGLLDSLLSSVLRGSWETLVPWRHCNSSSCALWALRQLCFRSPHPSTYPLSTFLSPLPAEQQVSWQASRARAASPSQKGTQAHSVSCQRGPGGATSARGMRQTARQAQL